MAIRNPQELRALCPAGSRLLGLDVGRRTLGLALSDPGWVVASPVATIARTRFREDVRALARIVREREVGALLLGLPLNLNGSDSPTTQSIRDFARTLLDQATALGFSAPPELAFWDERFSTAAVTRFLISADTSRKRRGEVVDKAAAAYILQGALDALGRPASFPIGYPEDPEDDAEDPGDDPSEEDGPVR